MKTRFQSGLYFIVSLLSLFSDQLMGAVEHGQGAILQASIEVLQENPSKKDPDKIMPSSMVKLRVKVKNVGSRASEPGTVFVRYAYPPPLTDQKGSVLFQTEKLTMTSIMPMQTLTFTFGTPHQWPPLYDYIRFDWGLRQYQAVVDIDNTDILIGSLAITFSAYYYQAPARQIPSDVPSR